MMQSDALPTAEPLTGASLEVFLDRLEADLEETSLADANLAARLEAQPLTADTLQAISRLSGLWMTAGRAAQARNAVDVDGAALLASTAPRELDIVKLCLERYRLEIACRIRDDAAMLTALHRMKVIVTEASYLPDPLACQSWQVLKHSEAGSLESSLATTELRRSLNLATPERATYRAWDEAHYYRCRAWAFWKDGQHDGARNEARIAVAALVNAAPGQDVDENDWLRLGDSIIEYAPDQMVIIEQQVRRMANSWVLPRLRELEVQIARLDARARHASGDLSGALERCADARYSLEPCATGGLDFIDYHLPWLIEAKRWDEAGKLAFDHLYLIAEETHPIVCEVVPARLHDESDTSVWWPLCAMRACQVSETLNPLLQHVAALPSRSPVVDRIFGAALGLDFDAARWIVFDAARAVALEREANNVWVMRLNAVAELDRGITDAATATTRLIAAAEAGNLCDARTTNMIVGTHAKATSLRAALESMPHGPDTGLGAYRLALWIEKRVDEHLERCTEAERDDLKAMAANIKRTLYERGRDCMESYARTGRGHPLDASAHVYSMLCNNLAIIYRSRDRRYEDAIAMHERGIAASPFAEHYDGILNCCIELEDDNRTAGAAENLWHFTFENGFSRHDPGYYVSRVMRALARLGRTAEMSIWYERLVNWQEHMEEGDREDPNQLSDEALYARLNCLFPLASPFPSETIAQWEVLRPQVDASKYYWNMIKAGDLLRNLGRPEEAIRYFEREAALNPRSNSHDVEVAKSIADTIRTMRESLAQENNVRPWWKFWK